MRFDGFDVIVDETLVDDVVKLENRHGVVRLVNIGEDE